MKKTPEPIYEQRGETAVLLLHAYTGSPNDVLQLARFLARANLTVYAPLFSGHGTPNPEDILAVNPNKWYNEAQNALAFLKSEGHTRIFIFGLSMGGIFATHLLSENDASVLGGGIFSSPITKTQQNNIAPSFKTYVDMVLRQNEPDAAKRIQRLNLILAKQPAQLLEIEQWATSAFNALPDFRVPYFIGQAGLDELIDANNVSETIEARIKNNLPVTFQLYEKSGHVLTVGPQKNKLFADVLAFITACEIL